MLAAHFRQAEQQVSAWRDFLISDVCGRSASGCRPASLGAGRGGTAVSSLAPPTFLARHPSSIPATHAMRALAKQLWLIERVRCQAHACDSIRLSVGYLGAIFRNSQHACIQLSPPRRVCALQLQLFAACNMRIPDSPHLEPHVTQTRLA